MTTFVKDEKVLNEEETLATLFDLSSLFDEAFYVELAREEKLTTAEREQERRERDEQLRQSQAAISAVVKQQQLSWEDPHHRRFFSRTCKPDACPKCMGEGFIGAYNRIQNGVCFRCGGSGNK